MRTTDVAAARRFYAGLFGEPVPLQIVELPAAALARGARPHWLGELGVDEVAAALATFAAW